MLVPLEGEGRLNQRLYNGLRRAIVDGRLTPGSRLPSTRSLARDLGLSRNVVLMAFAQLIEEGYARARSGSGTVVADPVPDALLTPGSPGLHRKRRDAHPALSSHARRVVALAPLPAVGRPPRDGLLYDFRYGVPAVAEFPQQVWSRLVARHTRSMSTRSLGYGRALGLLRLRQAIADHVTRTRGVAATFEQVIIVNGTQQALDLVGRLVVDHDDCVVIEEPSYLSARQVFIAAGARLLAIPVDEHGIDVSRLPRGDRIRLAYVTPSHQFPLGGVLPLDRRRKLLQWASTTGALVVEDDYDSEFWYDGRPIEAIQGLDHDGRVIYIGTFSKVLFPALRLGYMILPASLVPPVAALKFLLDRHAPSLEQEVLADFMEGGYFERHVRRARARNAARREAMLASFRETFGDRARVAGENAGIHMVVWLPGIGAAEIPGLIARAADRRVGIYSVLPHFIRPPATAGLLLGYASLTEEEIRDGVRLLEDAIDRRTTRMRS